MESANSIINDPVFQVFIGHCTLLLLKTSLMSIVTVAVFYGSTPVKKVIKVKKDEDQMKEKTITEYPNVERVRRCHLNDLENVLPFVLLGFLYVTTIPDLTTASMVFRTFTISRFIHTFVYLFAVPQPSRFLAFLVGFLVNTFLAYHVVKSSIF